ncbi:MAG: MBL fold metallo-hydrolase [Pseudomonadota bacterium]
MIFEILLTSCLATDIDDCGSGRIPVSGDLGACRDRARVIAANVPASAEIQSFVCVEAGQFPELGFSEIAPGVFVHKGRYDSAPNQENRGDLANVGFVIGEASVAVIDTGMHPWIGRAMLNAIRRETALPISAIILTGAGPERVLGTGPLLEDGGSVIGHHVLAETLAERADELVRNLQDVLPDSLSPTDVVVPDDGVSGTRTISLGNRELTLTAHETGPAGYELTVLDEKSGTLFAGDLLYQRQVPALSGPPQAWIDTLKSLSELPATRAVPGHGPVAMRWPEGSGPVSRYLLTLEQDIKAEIAAGSEIEAAARRAGADEQYRWLNFDETNRRNAAIAYRALTQE